MTVSEAIGQALLVTLAGTGTLTLSACLYLGARELLRRVRRVERHLGSVGVNERE